MTAREFGLADAIAERIDEIQAAADWFCLRVNEWSCRGCGQGFRYHTYQPAGGGHLVVVWPSRDDPNMRAAIGERNGRAAIVPYEDSFGDAISYYRTVPS